MSELLQKHNHYLAPEAIVKINGKKLSQYHLFFNNLTIDMTIEGTDIFSFTLSDAINLEFEPQHPELFNSGNEVEIHIGYANNENSKIPLPLLFKGVITAINWNFSENNYLDITVEGKDYSFLLMKHKSSDNEKQLNWDNTSYSAIVEKIISQTYSNQFKKITIEDTKQIYNQVKYKEKNDYAFFNRLTKKNGFEFFIQKDEFYFRASPDIQNNEITLSYGIEILSFTPELNIDKQVTKVKVFATEFQAGKEKIVGEAPKNSLNNKKSLSIKEILKNISNIEYEMTANVSSVEEADKIAQLKLDELNSNLIKAELRCIGIPELKPGISIKLKGLGERFSTYYYITKAVHNFNEQGYEVTLSLASSSKTIKEFKL